MSKLRRTIVLGLAFAMVTAVAACGGDSDDDAADNTTTTAAEATTTTIVEAVDVQAEIGMVLSALPEGFLSVGDVDVFKEGVEASGALVIDVREVSEYEEGHIPGAVNIPLRTLAQNLDKIPTDQQVYVYCKSGFRAGQALASLSFLGYDNVLSYKPGWDGWTGAEQEVSTDGAEAAMVGAPDIDAGLVDAVDLYLSSIPEGFLSAGNAEAVQEAVDAGAVLIDVRTAGEYAEGHVAGAPNIDLRALVDGLADVPSDANVIVYCGSGHRASMAVAALQILGFDNVKGYGSTYASLVDAGFPTEA